MHGGHEPVLYVNARSSRPRTPSSQNAAAKVADILGGIPPDVDLLLPGSTEGLAVALAGYRIDVAVVSGLSWLLPRAVLDAARIGVLNVHPSLLPRYRGPSPIQWAIRNGDRETGVTAHWMDERIDTGNIVAQRGGIVLPEFVTFERFWNLVNPAVRDVVTEALDLAAAGYAGTPQNEAEATSAPQLEEEFGYVDWSAPARVIHNQVRTFYFGAGIPGPFARIGTDRVRLIRTRLTPGEGTRIECADGPIWVVAAEPV
ncbi:methionyl-tRNA formyltransferase [Amycolatopsis aidingensis]|uniref:methionyl-tRNA formyltransferase n=1 Tax=Amycolatopsis aidingensis TaxID=2842453 RepID=UPI001E3B74A8|nr:formyltransferase family protein [Amycolatopsis aidingensis]